MYHPTLYQILARCTLWPASSSSKVRSTSDYLMDVTSILFDIYSSSWKSKCLMLVSLRPSYLMLSLSLSLPFSCGKSQPMMLVHRPSMVDALKVSHLLEAVIDYNSRNGKTPSWHVTGQFTLNLHLHFMVVHTHIILSMGELVNINRSLIQEQKGYHTELIVHVEARYHSWFLGYIHDLIG